MTSRGDPPRFTTLSTEDLFDGWLIRVERLNLADPSGEEFDREVVRHPGAVGVVPVADDGTVTLIRQYRPSIGEVLLEIPAGVRDKSREAVEETANRELIEEVGLEAGRLRHLITMYNSPGFCDQRTELFLATDLHPRETNRQGPEERQITLATVHLDEVSTLVREGQLLDAMSTLGLLLAAQAFAEDG